VNKTAECTAQFAKYILLHA